LLGLYLAPNASKGFNDFQYKYLKGRKEVNKNVLKQINDHDIIYVSNFDPKTKTGRNFTLEHFNRGKMSFKISADRIHFIDKDSTYRLNNYVKRKIKESNDILEVTRRKDTLFSFDLEDLTPEEYIAETL